MDLFGRLARALASLLVLAGAVLGLPLALLEWGSWPINGIPTRDQITNLPSTVVTDTALFGILTVAAWVVWAAFTASVAAEVVAIIRGVAGRDLPFCGPLQRRVRPLVAAFVMSVTTAGSLSGSAAGGLLLHERPAAADVEQPIAYWQAEPAGAPVPPHGDAASDERTIVVRANDTYWEIAERELGDGLRWREIREMNAGRTMPDGSQIEARSDLLQPGWVLVVPDDVAERHPGPAAPDAESPPNRDPEASVQAGDDLWRIAEDHLTQVLGRVPNEHETSDYWARLVEANHDRYAEPGNPDLIYAGQSLVLPDIDVPPIAAAPPTSVEPEAPPTPADPMPDQAGPTPTSTPTATAEPTTTGLPAKVPPSDSSAPSPTEEQESPTTTSPSASTVPSSTDENDSDLPMSAVAAVASTALAVGLTAAIRRRRRQRNYFAPTRLPQPPPNEGLHRELILAADEDSVEFLRAALGLLAEGLAESGQPCKPLIVQHGQGQVEVLLDRPTKPAVDGWQADDDGATWSLEASAVRVDGPLRWMSPAPLLVSLGRPDEDGQIYLDLEAPGLVTLTGDPTTRLDILRSFASEVAHSPFGEATSLVVVGELGISTLFDECEQVTVQYGWDSVVDHLSAWTAQSRETLAETGSLSPFAARNADPEDDSLLSLLVLATRPPESPDVLAFLHDGPATTAVVVAGDEPLPGSVIVECSPDELWLPQLGLSCVPQTLDEERAKQIAELLSAASDPGGTELQLTLDIGGGGNGSGTQLHDQPADAFADPAYDVLVRCLGDVVVEGTFKRRLRPKEAAALCYIALHSPVSAEWLEDALWASPTTDTRRRRLINIISQCRDTIGPQHLPHLQEGRYTVGPGVKTDLDLFEARVDAAAHEADWDTAADLLLGALSLCTGQVFHTRSNDRDSFGWIEAGNLVSHWEIKLTHLAQQLAEDCLEHGDTRRAVEACDAGLRAMNTHKGCTEALMRAHAMTGDLAVVQHVYRAHVAALELIQIDQVAESTLDLYDRLLNPGPPV